MGFSVITLNDEVYTGCEERKVRVRGKSSPVILEDGAIMVAMLVLVAFLGMLGVTIVNSPTFRELVSVEDTKNYLSLQAVTAHRGNVFEVDQFGRKGLNTVAASVLYQEIHDILTVNGYTDPVCSALTWSYYDDLITLQRPDCLAPGIATDLYHKEGGPCVPSPVPGGCYDAAQRTLEQLSNDCTVPGCVCQYFFLCTWNRTTGQLVNAPAHDIANFPMN